MDLSTRIHHITYSGLYFPMARVAPWLMDWGYHYLVQRAGNWVYSICILEGYSREILAGMAAEYQDEITVLQILAAALAEHGCLRECSFDVLGEAQRAAPRREAARRSAPV